MRRIATAVLLLLTLSPMLSGQFRTHTDRLAPPPALTRDAWAQQSAWIRAHVLASAGLLPLPERTPLEAAIVGEQRRPGYRVSKVHFESLPGFVVTGNLYQPEGSGPFPAVLSAHGHWTYGRLEHNELVSGPGRAITLARQGFVVFAYDMIGYNDSRQLTHAFGGRRESLWGLSLAGLQLWNSIRSVDFLQSLPQVRKDAIGITGESGGGTQTFLLAAVDDRVAAAVPVNMISLHMQGGCLCENPPGLRRDLTNVDIAATIAPRPLLMVSATGDWTRETLEVEFPAVRSRYALRDAEDRVQAVRFTAEHNYNKDSREAMYGWMARWLQGAPPGATRAEPPFTPDALPSLLVFHGRTPPAGLRTADELTAAWIDAAARQLRTTPLAVRAAALRHALGFAEGGPTERTTASQPGRTVLVAGDDAALVAALRHAGLVVRPVDFSPFDADAAAKIRHFETYNRTRAGQRVADIVSALRAAPGAVLVASGDVALAAALAAAIEPPQLAIVDARGFDTSRDEDFLRHLDIPGLRRAGDLQTASEMAPSRIVIHNAGAAFVATQARVSQAALGPAGIVAEVRRAVAGR